jgi:hypothetical protein
MKGIIAIILLIVVILIASMGRETFTKNTLKENKELKMKQLKDMLDRRNTISLTAEEMNKYYFGYVYNLSGCYKGEGPIYWEEKGPGSGYIGTSPLAEKITTI